MKLSSLIIAALLVVTVMSGVAVINRLINEAVSCHYFDDRGAGTTEMMSFALLGAVTLVGAILIWRLR